MIIAHLTSDICWQHVGHNSVDAAVQFYVHRLSHYNTYQKVLSESSFLAVGYTLTYSHAKVSNNICLYKDITIYLMMIVVYFILNFKY